MKLGSRRSKLSIRNPKSDVQDQSLAFRRSRTLTGSASSTVVSVIEPRSQLKSPRLKEHELRKHRRLLFTAFCGMILLSASCFWLLDQYVGSVTDISSSKAVPTSSYADGTYVESVDDYFESRPLERFMFALQTERLNNFMSMKHPEISSVELTESKGLVDASVNIEFRKPVAVWQVAGTKYYVDQGGETFLNSVYGEPAVTVRDESGINVQSSQLVASSRLLRFLGQTVGGINASGIGTVTQVTIPGGTLRQLDVTLDSRPYRLKTHMDREPTGQVADIVATVKYLDSQNITPEYVDTRVSGKAFYR